MIDIFLVVGILLLLGLVTFLFLRPKKKHALQILDVDDLHPLTPAQLQEVLASGIDILVKFYDTSFLDSGAGEIKIMVQDTSRFLAKQYIPDELMQAATSRAEARLPQRGAIREEQADRDESLFYLIRNLYLIKMMKPGLCVLDMRWIQSLVEMCRAQAREHATEIVEEPVEIDMRPDYMQQKSRFVNRGRRATAFDSAPYGDDFEKESVLSPYKSAPKPRAFFSDGFGADGLTSIARGSGAVPAPAPAGLIDRTDLDAVRGKLLGDVDPTRTQTLANDYSFLDDHPIIYEH